MNKTKIEWADATWNPVTGCLNDCEYCYARGIARRFGGWDYSSGSVRMNISEDKTYICLDTEMFRSWDCKVYEHRGQKIADLSSAYRISKGRKLVKAPFPFGFTPTLHRYRLTEPQTWKEPRTVFVCSMADLFGEWVPDEWITEVFAACAAAPQHRYLFLTKNPKRYVRLDESGKLPTKHWYGTTVTTKRDLQFISNAHHTFISVEPILEDFPNGVSCEYLRGLGLPTKGKPKPSVKNTDWIIVGAETGNRSGKVTPRKEWIDHITQAADEAKIPVFMKDSLIPIVGEENMRRELPWEV